MQAVVGSCVGASGNVVGAELVSKQGLHCLGHQGTVQPSSVGAWTRLETVPKGSRASCKQYNRWALTWY